MEPGRKLPGSFSMYAPRPDPDQFGRSRTMRQYVPPRGQLPAHTQHAIASSPPAVLALAFGCHIAGVDTHSRTHRPGTTNSGCIHPEFAFLRGCTCPDPAPVGDVVAGAGAAQAPAGTAWRSPAGLRVLPTTGQSSLRRHHASGGAVDGPSGHTTTTRHPLPADRPAPVRAGLTRTTHRTLRTRHRRRR